MITDLGNAFHSPSRDIGDFGRYVSYGFMTEWLRKSTKEANQTKCRVLFHLRSKDGLFMVENRGNDVEQNREYQDKGNDVTHQ